MGVNGRPTKYNKKTADEICDRLAGGESLNSICRSDHMPHKVTIMRWLLSDKEIYSGFRNQYDYARKIQYEFLADDVIDIADDARNDWMERNGIESINGEAVSRSRLRVDTRKWFLSKVLPKFSDKQQEEKTAGAPQKIEVTLIDPDQSD